MSSSFRDPRLLAIAIGATLLFACLIGRHSDDFACKTSDECDPDRGCVRGFCVVPTCPDGCSSCQGFSPDRTGYAICVIDCPGNSCAGKPITCPSGIACQVQCNGAGACQSVDCSQATGCTIACSGTNSCDQGVTCGTGPCAVTCSGTNSCDQGVACSASCSCNVTCGNNACSTPATCPSAACDTGSGCGSGGTCNGC